MPEIHDLLDGEARRHEFASNRDFGDLVRARRRRDRSVRAAGGGTLAVVALAGVALTVHLTGSGRTAVVVDGGPTPRTTLAAPAGDLCSIRRLDISLSWIPQANGSLKGTLSAKNTSSQSCRLSGKPQVIPLGLDGATAAVSQSQTLEDGTDSDVPAGYVATSTLTWNSWCGGDTLSGKVMVFINPNGTTDPASVTIEPTTIADPMGERVAAVRHPGCTAGENSASFIHETFFSGGFDPAPTAPLVPGQTVTGSLETVGGPVGNAPRGVEGTVIATDQNGQTQSTRVGTSGSFTLHLTAGTYTLTGKSPAYGDGQGTCRADQPVVVTDTAGASDIVVACSMK